jgi:hypothetical protein
METGRVILITEIFGIDRLVAVVLEQSTVVCDATAQFEGELGVPKGHQGRDRRGDQWPAGTR